MRTGPVESHGLQVSQTIVAREVHENGKPHYHSSVEKPATCGSRCISGAKALKLNATGLEEHAHNSGVANELLEKTRPTRVHLELLVEYIP
jgi:hypothetical protein